VGLVIFRRPPIKPSGHIICTLSVSGLIYFIFKSRGPFLISLLAGIFIDLDHILDYYIQEGATLKFKNIYFWCGEREFEFIFLFFHSLELVLLLWVTISILKLGLHWIAFAIGITQHIILDMLFNKDMIYAYSYLLSYRIMRRFRSEDLLKNN
jgi:membrane-bound metal-dependent hydrolase YbcI (DUF457 family)